MNYDRREVVDFTKLQYFILIGKEDEAEELKSKYNIEKLSNDVLLKCFNFTEAGIKSIGEL